MAVSKQLPVYKNSRGKVGLRTSKFRATHSWAAPLLLALALCAVGCSAAAPPQPQPHGSVTGPLWNYVWDKFFDWMMTSNFSAYNPPAPVENITCNNSTDVLWRRPDGSCNNLAQPGWGMVNSILRRLGAVSYVDGAAEYVTSAVHPCVITARPLAVSE